MAEFTIRDVEGMRQLRIDLKDESIRSVRSALSHMSGSVRMTAPIPGPGAVLRSLISREAAIRPRYSGTGSVYLQPSMRGYHVFEARDMRWILEPGVFWAAEGETRLGVRLEKMLPSFWIGDGLINFQTVVHGDGRVAINAPGPVEEVEIGEGELLVKGRMVLGRTAGVRYTTRRVAGIIQSLIAGEPRARSFSGPGRALVCWTPYWNEYMHSRLGVEDDAPSAWT
jgi:uncharacterized protein (AIM24 family)